MAVHVVTVIHRPQGVEEEAGGEREPGGVQGDHQEEFILFLNNSFI
jgi:hypothetical protein